jgi:predicted double-glycine peptidase
VTSQKEARFKTTLKQRYDFSCGSAALATLLTFHYADPVGEEDIFQSMYDAGNQDKIKNEGFSLLDMKNYLSARGYKSDGFRTSLDKLKDVGVPAIVLINNKGYEHFVVIKGVTATEVLLGDPSNGVRRMPRTKFETMWGGLLFLIWNKDEIAKKYFNQENEWRINPRPSMEFALARQELSNITWLLPGKNDF